MTDVIKKKSRLELEKERSKKRPFSEISGFAESQQLTVHDSQRKKLKFNDTISNVQHEVHATTANGFLSDVIIKKSRIELEKEAALQRQL